MKLKMSRQSLLPASRSVRGVEPEAPGAGGPLGPLAGAFWKGDPRWLDLARAQSQKTRRSIVQDLGCKGLTPPIADD